MEVKFNKAGNERKALVMAVSEVVGTAAKYQGAPSFAYAVGDYTIDKNGTLTGEDNAEILASLAERGYHGDSNNCTETLTIEMPLDGFTSEKLDNLIKLVKSKEPLLKAALGAYDLPIQQPEDRLAFPWFAFTDDSDTIKAYTTLIEKICSMAKEQNRITATPKDVVNEKYAFRCFLLRLGFIGDEYKAARKILLKNLDGNGAYAMKGANTK